MSLRGRLSRLRDVSPPSSPSPPSAPAALDPSNRAALLDELRARMSAMLARSAVRPAAPRPVDGPDLPFTTLDTPSGPLHVRTQRLSAAHRIGHAPITPARSASAELLALLALDPTLASRDPKRALYLDTETTGLSGGAGTIAFLVGLAYWDDGGLVVEQLLVRSPGEEAPMLERVAARVREASMLVTFNGKAFDLPLLRTRFVMARMDPPEEPAHLDLLHVARRLHKPRGIECRLTRIERDVLGFERVDDVASSDVSACYLHFLRTGDTRALLGVVEHNAWDVVAMAALVGLYGEPVVGANGEAGESRLAPVDLAGVARTLKRAGALERAFEVAHLAVERGGGVESLRARAEIARARGDRWRALLDFEALAQAVDCPRTRLELAKLYEHHVKEPARALALVQQGVAESPERARGRAERLSRKIAKKC